MNVGILGSGAVGRDLGLGFVTLGHQVKLGTRAPDDPKMAHWLAQAGPRASAGSFADAARFAEVAVLATAWSGTPNAIALAGPKHVAGKVVIDATNPLAPVPGGPPRLAVSGDDSGGEQVQRLLPQAKVVKAFNTVGHTYMFRPQFPGGPPDMPICGNDAGAREAVARICEAFGWSVLDLGGIESARYLEGLAMAWIVYGARTGSWDHAWKLLRK